MISQSRFRTFGHFGVQNLANTGWSFAYLSIDDEASIWTVLKEITCNSHATISEGGDITEGEQGLFWSLWHIGRPDFAWSVLDSWLSIELFLDAMDCGLFLMDSEMKRDHHKELVLLSCLAQTASGDTLPPLVTRWCYELSPADIPTIQTKEGTPVPWAYRKLALVVEHIEELMEVDVVELLLEGLEDFAKGAAKKWLKVPAGSRSQVMECAANSLPMPSHCSQLCVGVFIGYTAARLSMATPRPHPRGTAPLVCGLEGDPVHVVVSRHLLDLARLSSNVEVWAGHAKDALPMPLEILGGQSLSLICLDLRGAAAIDDLAVIRGLGVAFSNANALASSVLKPGAPIMAWSIRGDEKTSVWSLLEYMSEDIEDWKMIHSL